jgi:hypothetical protein
MVSIVENPPICAVSHSHAHGEVVMMEIVVLLFHLRVSPRHFLMQNWGLSPIHLLPQQKAQSQSCGTVHLPWWNILLLLLMQP